MTSAVVDDTLNPSFLLARKYLKFVRNGLPVHKTWESDLIKVFDCFEYSVVFCLPIGKSSWFRSFNVRGWVAKEHRLVNVGEFLTFTNDVSYLYLMKIALDLKLETWCLF